MRGGKAEGRGRTMMHLSRPILGRHSQRIENNAPRQRQCPPPEAKQASHAAGCISASCSRPVGLILTGAAMPGCCFRSLFLTITIALRSTEAACAHKQGSQSVPPVAQHSPTHPETRLVMAAYYIVE
jgi:hypothetical protein